MRQSGRYVEGEIKERRIPRTPEVMQQLLIRMIPDPSPQKEPTSNTPNKDPPNKLLRPE